MTLQRDRLLDLLFAGPEIEREQPGGDGRGDRDRGHDGVSPPRGAC
jgi:hypothetical protein